MSRESQCFGKNLSRQSQANTTATRRLAWAVGCIGLGSMVASCTVPTRPDTVPNGYTFDYLIDDRETYQLVQAFDDGANTYIQFRAAGFGNLTIRDETGETIAWERTGSYAKVHGRHERLVLTLTTGHTEIHRPGSIERAAGAGVPSGTRPDSEELHRVTAEVSGLRQQVSDLEAELAAARAQLAAYASRLVVYFGNNSARVTAAPEAIEIMAGSIRDRTAISITGYTDATYLDEKGARLAQRRAEAVQRALIAHGVPSENVEVEFYGAGHFAVDNTTVEGKQMNRRVEIVSKPADAPSGAG